MASRTTQPRSDATSALELELAELEAAVEASLPPGVALSIEGLPFDREVIADEIEGLLELIEDHARAKRKYQELIASWWPIAQEARTFVSEVRAALGRYLDGRSRVERSPALRQLAAEKRWITRELREAGRQMPFGSIDDLLGED